MSVDPSPAEVAALADRPTPAARNVMIVGVGGQGVLMISKALALIGQKQGLSVKQSEVHGMAKRGGVVFSHVRFGERVWSPTIVKGEADALIALEWAEGNRKFGAATRYAAQTPAEIADKVAESYALDATTIATELGEPRAANTVLLGVLSTSMGYPMEHWLSTLESLAPAKTRAINRKAFEAGRAWGRAARDDPSLRFDANFAVRGAPSPRQDIAVAVEINAAWCKGCDICVKLCPERCLKLNAERPIG